MATIGKTMNAEPGVSTRMGNVGARSSASRIATSAELIASTIAWNARPASTERPETPVALNTAKSRVRSITWR